MRVLPYGETVTLRRRVLATDADGEVIRDAYGQAQYVNDDREVTGCSIAPAGSAGQAFSFEAVGNRTSQVTVRYVVHFPPGVEADADDHLRWRGEWWQIEGEVGYLHSPFSGRLGPVELYIKRVTG